ncbi:MAG: trimeric intracellular cation channel family protein [Bacteroidota bacterium]|nr:trimeric intracellular cation channel family protein [Bacteroidota bacterium]
MFEVLEILGVVAFAFSGALAGVAKKMDIFGIFVVAIATALGGGMLRDVLIGNTPVLWMREVSYLWLVLIGTLTAIVFRKKLIYFRTSLFLFDSIGLGLFTIIGVEKGIQMGFDPIVCIGLGTLTACFGGVVRDILCNDIPVIFQKEIYATLCIVGGILYFGLKEAGVNNDLIYMITTIFIIVLRILVVKYKWSLPKIE